MNSGKGRDSAPGDGTNIQILVRRSPRVTAGVQHRAHPVGSVCLVRSQEYRVPLGDVQRQALDLGRLREGAVRLDDRERMVVNAEANVREVADVENTQAVTGYMLSVHVEKQTRKCGLTSCWARE